jgi:single-strand DNA-binding protein
MASVNKAIILGNLGRDPELRHTQAGKAVCTLRLATNEVWSDASGERQERTEWHTVVVWGRSAENCNQYLKKGRTVFIEGRIQTRKWQDKEGNDRYSTEIVADRVQFIGGQAGGGASDSSSGDSSFGGGGDLAPPPAGGDDIPF